MCLQSRADLTALDCPGLQLLSDATLVSFQSLAPEGSDASFHCVPGPALAEWHLAEARRARPLPWGADIPHACHFPPKSLEVSENGKQGARVRHRLPTTGDPDLEYVGVRLGEAAQGGANQRSLWGPEKEGGPGSVPDPLGWTLGRGWGLLSGGTNYNTSPPSWPGGVQGPAKNLGSEKSRF